MLFDPCGNIRPDVQECIDDCWGGRGALDSCSLKVTGKK
ncbi:hypothetical protein CBM2595_A80030 [Cupriavidus taiwanensis]|nr:hypothetical protein CBM2595_A80030 [Cupriavidus taiwanensis]